MNWRVVFVAAVVAVALAIVVAQAYGFRGGWGVQQTNDRELPQKVGAKAWGWGKGVWEVKHGGWARGVKPCANITLYSTTRQLSIKGDGINATLTVDVVNKNATSPYGRIFYGSGTVELGEVEYSVKNVVGEVGPKGARLVMYASGALIHLAYHNGRYYAVVKPFGRPECLRYNGTATLQIS